MTSSTTASDFSRINDEIPLLQHSSDSSYAPFSSPLGFPPLSKNAFYHSSEADARSFLDSNSEHCARRVAKQSSIQEDYIGPKTSLNRCFQPSLPQFNDESLELQERILESEEKPNGGASEVENQAEPGTLSSTKSRSDLVIAIVAAALCLPFCLVFGYALHLNDKLVDDRRWDLIQQVLKILANIYPIFFGLTLGQATRKLAAWQLESGISLMSLEQLMGSLSFGSAFTTQLSLDGYNHLGIVLVLIWALSPLAGQASFRLLSVEQAQMESHVNISYMNSITNTEASLTVDQGDDDVRGGLGEINAVYTASLFAPAWIQASPLDLWGNIRIPDISHEGNASYSSLLGVPAVHIPSEGNTTFTIETSYLSVACQKISTSDNFIEYNIILLNETKFMKGQLRHFWGPPPEHNVSRPHSYTFTLSTNYLLANRGLSSKVIPGHKYPPGQSMLLLQSQDLTIDSYYHLLDTPVFTQAYCSLSNAYVQSTVSCTAGDCAVTSARPSNLLYANTNATDLMFVDAFYETSKSLMEASASRFNGDEAMYVKSSPTQMYLQNPYFGNEVNGTSWGMADLSKVSEADVSIRLEQILNTFWQASVATFMSFNLTSDPTSESYRPQSLNFTLGTNVVWQKHYRCKWPWLAVYFFATTIMVSAAAMCVWLSWSVQSPEILGYCSSLVKDSRFIHIPSKSTMRATERAKELGSLRLRLADVAGDQDVGHIAIVNADAVDGETIVPLSKVRKYR